MICTPLHDGGSLYGVPTNSATVRIKLVRFYETVFPGLPGGAGHLDVNNAPYGDSVEAPEGSTIGTASETDSEVKSTENAIY